MDSHDLTALTSYTSYPSCSLLFMAKKLFMNTTYAFDCCKRVREAFFPFFLLKLKKAGLARKKAGKLYMLLFFYFARSSTRAEDRRHSLVPGFHTTCVIYDLHVDSPILQTEEKRQGKLLDANYTKADIDDMVKALDIPRETKRKSKHCLEEV